MGACVVTVFEDRFSAMRILAVGIATVDIINLVDSCPKEDTEARAREQRVSRGGNATNTLVVLSQLGHRCSWGGVVAKERDSHIILDDLARYGVDVRYAINHAGGKSPTSYVTLSRMGGSRTIVHFRKLPEFSDQDFAAIDREGFDWLHFEGRNITELEKMMGRLGGDASRSSLEIEKPREGIERLFPYPGVLMFSGSYARHRGFNNGADFLAAIRSESKNSAVMTCAWGERGAWGVDQKGRITYAPAFSPRKVVDTLGAGDVFNAAVVHGVLEGRAMSELLGDACRLAGEKCGRMGFDLSANFTGP